MQARLVLIDGGVAEVVMGVRSYRSHIRYLGVTLLEAQMVNLQR